jgi:hypothetical protein
VDVLWLLAVGVATSAWCLAAAPRLGATFDEPHHMKAGLTNWRTGSNKILMSAGCMPLPVDVQTLPVYVWERCRGTRFDPVADMDTILPVARAANLTFWWLLLVYAMRLGRTFGGAWGGRLAVGFVGFDPNFLGHACLATTDISVVAMMLALLYHYHHGQECGWGRRVLVPGLLYGLATLAKASGMVFGAQAMIVMGLYRLAVRGDLTPPPGTSLWGKVAHVWRAGFRLRKDLAWTAAVGFALLFVYVGSDWGTERTFVEWAETLPDGPAKAVMLPVSQNLKVFPNAGEGLLQQIKHNIRGHGTYFLGELHERATWAYFPGALSMKTPVPMLALLIAVLLLRPRGLNNPLGWVALVLFLFSFNCRVQIGIRFMFTLMAITYVALAAAAARSWADGTDRPIPRSFVAGLLASMVGTAIWVWPHGLSYFNQLWGGTPAGHALLHDSNHDWGQGLPDLKEWHRTHGEPPLWVWYYGTDPAVLKPPFRHLPLHTLPVTVGDQVRLLAGDGYLAVGVSLMHGYSNITPSATVVVDYLRTKQPVARTTHFFIYDLRRP